jgi:hypothetical protein
MWHGWHHSGKGTFEGFRLWTSKSATIFGSGLEMRTTRTMPDEDWIKSLPDGRRVKFSYQELLEDKAFITAQIEGSEVVYSIILTKTKNPLSHEDVELRFRDELSKK